jgi:hypothetical protein
MRHSNTGQQSDITSQDAVDDDLHDLDDLDRVGSAVNIERLPIGGMIESECPLMVPITLPIG